MFKFNSFTKKAILGLSAVGLLATSQPANAIRKDALIGITGMIACAGMAWNLHNKLNWQITSKQRKLAYNCCLAGWAISLFGTFACATGIYSH